MPSTQWPKHSLRWSQRSLAAASACVSCRTRPICVWRTINSVKQAAQFGIAQSGQKIATLAGFINDVHGLGLKEAQGLTIAEATYWDLNDETRQWSKRFFETVKAMPNMLQTGTYSAVKHYLKAIEAAGTDETSAVVAKMRELPV